MMLNPADEALAARLPEGVLRPLTPAYLEEPRRRVQGRAGLVAAPRNVDEVAAVVRACAEARVGIVPRGGGTGLANSRLNKPGVGCPSRARASASSCCAARRCSASGVSSFAATSAS